MDCISENGSTLAIAKSFASKAGKIVTILPVKDESIDKQFPDVKHDFTLVYTTLGDYFDFGPIPFAASPEDQKATEEWCVFPSFCSHLGAELTCSLSDRKQKVPELVTSGKLKANPVWHQEGGLAAINDGLELLKAGKASHSSASRILSLKAVLTFFPMTPELGAEAHLHVLSLALPWLLCIVEERIT